MNSNCKKQQLIRLKNYSCTKINPAVVTKRPFIRSVSTWVWKLWCLVDILWVVPTNAGVPVSRPGIVRSNKYMQMTELDYVSSFPASIYIFIVFVLKRDYFIWVLFFSTDVCWHCIKDVSGGLFSVSERAKISRSFLSEGFVHSRHSLQNVMHCYNVQISFWCHAFKGQAYSMLSCTEWPQWS